MARDRKPKVYTRCCTFISTSSPGVSIVLILLYEFTARQYSPTMSYSHSLSPSARRFKEYRLLAASPQHLFSFITVGASVCAISRQYVKLVVEWWTARRMMCHPSTGSLRQERCKRGLIACCRLTLPACWLGWLSKRTVSRPSARSHLELAFESHPNVVRAAADAQAYVGDMAECPYFDLLS